MAHQYTMTLTEENYLRLCRGMVRLRSAVRKEIKELEQPDNHLEQEYGSEIVLTRIRLARDIEEFTEIYTSLIQSS